MPLVAGWNAAMVVCVNDNDGGQEEVVVGSGARWPRPFTLQVPFRKLTVDRLAYCPPRRFRPVLRAVNVRTRAQFGRSQH